MSTIIIAGERNIIIKGSKKTLSHSITKQTLPLKGKRANQRDCGEKRSKHEETVAG